MRRRRARIASCTEGGIDSTDSAVLEPEEEDARTRSARTPVSFELWAPASAASDRTHKQTTSDRMMRGGPIMTFELWQKYGVERLNRDYAPRLTAIDATTGWDRRSIRRPRQWRS